MSKLLISYNFLAQMMALSLNKKYDYIYHSRFLEEECSNQSKLTKLNERENKRLLLLQQLGKVQLESPIRSREQQKVLDLIREYNVTELTIVGSDEKLMIHQTNELSALVESSRNQCEIKCYVYNRFN